MRNQKLKWRQRQDGRTRGLPSCDSKKGTRWIKGQRRVDPLSEACLQLHCHWGDFLLRVGLTHTHTHTHTCFTHTHTHRKSCQISDRLTGCQHVLPVLPLCVCVCLCRQRIYYSVVCRGQSQINRKTKCQPRLPGYTHTHTHTHTQHTHTHTHTHTQYLKYIV